jgi:CBS domain-containing protein
MKVDRITLFFFGGMAGMHEKRFTPKTEFRMAIAGPMMSLAISLVFLVVYNVTSFVYVAAVSSYLYKINLILAIFNLVPGFPLDGGRVLRSVLWYWTNDFKRATKIAATGGKVVAYFLIFVGFANMITGNLGGLWFVFIGFFLLLLSTLSYEQVVIKDALHGKHAGDFIMKKFTSFDAGMSLKQAIARYFIAESQDAYPVVKDHRFEGVILFNEVQAIPKHEWTRLKVKDVMMPASKTGKVNKKTSAYTALFRMIKNKLPFLPVVDGKKLVGVVKRDTILRYVKLKETREKLGKMGFKV